MDNKRFLIVSFMFFIFALIWNGLAGIVDATNSPILTRFNTISTIALTMPVNGGGNARVAPVRRSAGNLRQGHLLATGGSAGEQAPTVLDVAPDGTTSVFSRIAGDRCPGGMGSSTGLAVLRDGWVIVGFMPRQPEAGGGCLIVLDNTGGQVETFSGSLIQGPYDIIAYENDFEAKLFVTNLLNRAAGPDSPAANEGSVVRLNLNVPVNGIPRISSMTVIASGFPGNVGSGGAVTGPTGAALSPACTGDDEDNCPDSGERREHLLYVADSGSNRIAVIDNALTRTTSAETGATLCSGGSLNEPRGLIVAPNGHIIAINRADGVITEITPRGQQIAKVAAGQFRQTAWVPQPLPASYTELAEARQSATVVTGTAKHGRSGAKTPGSIEARSE